MCLDGYVVWFGRVFHGCFFFGDLANSGMINNVSEKKVVSTLVNN